MLSAVLVAFALSLALAPVVLRLLHHLRVLDHPSARSSHDQPIPRGGGIATSLGAAVALATSSVMVGANRMGILVVACGLGLVGLVEDLVGISPLSRLALQAATAMAALPWLLAGLTVAAATHLLIAAGVWLWLIAYVNAFNFMDGIDGISVTQAAVAGIAWYAIGTGEQVAPFAVGGAIVAAAALGFAPFNIPRARMFLGDVGSYFIGGWLGAMAVLGIRSGLPPEAVIGPLAIYLADTGSTLLRRVLRRETWYLPHRDHCYQRLVRSGWSHMATTLLVGAFVLACSALGALSLVGPLPVRAVGDTALLAALAAYLAAPTRLGGRGTTVSWPS